MNKKNGVLSTIIYVLSIIIPVVGVATPIIMLVCFLYSGFTKTSAIILLVTSIICFILVKVFQEIRIKARQEVEYDEFGNSKKNGKYERMSAKERAVIDKQKLLDMERIIGSSALKRMVKEGSENPEEDMDNLIGMQEVKDEMARFVARVEFDQKNKNKERLSALHMCFTGNPGTGKTTVARIMTGFLYKNKAIKKNMMIETDGNFLKAGNSSDTALKTTMICRQAFGGVLFIDEAYALLSGDEMGDAAVATLIKLMEDERNRFIVILAGYGNEVRQLIRSNPGFESRINTYINFPDYSNVELVQIAMGMMRKMNMDFDSDDAIRKMAQRFENERQLDSFGNGRTARTVLSETLDNHAVNLKRGIIPESKRMLICEEDISVEIRKNSLWQ